MSIKYNSKEMAINHNQIDFQLVRDFSMWDDFYSSCPLMEDLGTSVKTYSKTYIILENSHHLLMSNGLWYDKDADILHTPKHTYRNWYSRLLLGYKISTYSQESYFTEKPIQFGVVPSDRDSFVIIRNKIIGNLGSFDSTTSFANRTFYVDINDQSNFIADLDYYKSLAIQKNASTLMEDKVECLYPHELQYSLSKLNKYIAYNKENLYPDFSSMILDFAGNVGFDITSIAHMAANFILSVYNADRYTTVPLFMSIDPNSCIYDSSIDQYGESSGKYFNMTSFETNTDDTSDILYNGYLALEYLYDYKYTDQSHTINSLNGWMNDEYGLSVDMMKYILPKVVCIKGTDVGSNLNDVYVVNRDYILSDYSNYPCNGIISAIRDTSNFVVTTIYKEYIDSTWSDLTSNLTISESDLKTEFFTAFEDLSSETISQLISDLTNPFELIDSSTIWVPPIMMDSTIYGTYSDVSNNSKLYLFSLIVSKILQTFSHDSTYNGEIFLPLDSYTTNLAALNILDTYYDVTNYQRYSDSNNYSIFFNRNLSFNAKFNIIPLDVDVFNPQIIDTIRSISASLSTYSTGNSMVGSDGNTLILASDENIIDFDSSEDIYFVSQELNGLFHQPIDAINVGNTKYNNTTPSNLFLMETEDSTGYDLVDIKLKFIGDDNRLEYVPVDLATSNKIEIPYKGLLLINDILDSTNMSIDSLYIKRDLTSNTWMIKMRLLQYDGQNIDRNVKFQFVDGNEISGYQPIAYEFGLGFEMVSSENISDMELLKILYIVLDTNQADNNLVVEKIMQNADKLKLMFRKLTTSPIILRTVLGDSDEQSIINTVDITI